MRVAVPGASGGATAAGNREVRIGSSSCLTGLVIAGCSAAGHIWKTKHVSCDVRRSSSAAIAAVHREGLDWHQRLFDRIGNSRLQLGASGRTRNAGRTVRRSFGAVTAAGISENAGLTAAAAARQDWPSPAAAGHIRKNQEC